MDSDPPPAANRPVRSTSAVPRETVRPRIRVPAGTAVVMPAARSLPLGPSSRARIAAVPTAPSRTLSTRWTGTSVPPCWRKYSRTAVATVRARSDGGQLEVDVVEDEDDEDEGAAFVVDVETVGAG